MKLNRLKMNICSEGWYGSYLLLATINVWGFNWLNTDIWRGRESTVSIATHYGLDGPGIKSRWGEIFYTHPDHPSGPLSLLYGGHWVSFSGVKWLGCGVDHLPPFSAEVKESVELYFYSLSEPSWLVLGWTLPLHLLAFECFRMETRVHTSQLCRVPYV